MEEAGQLVKEAAVVDLAAEFAVVRANHLFAAAVAAPVVVGVGVSMLFHCVGEGVVIRIN